MENVLVWHSGDDQSSVLGVLSLSCFSCIPGRAVEPAAAPVRRECRERCSLRTHLWVSGWALRVGQGKAAILRKRPCNR